MVSHPFFGYYYCLRSGVTHFLNKLPPYLLPVKLFQWTSNSVRSMKVALGSTFFLIPTDELLIPSHDLIHVSAADTIFQAEIFAVWMFTVVIRLYTYGTVVWWHYQMPLRLPVRTNQRASIICVMRTTQHSARTSEPTVMDKERIYGFLEKNEQPGKLETGWQSGMPGWPFIAGKLLSKKG